MNDLAKEQMCVRLKSGAEIWVDAGKVDILRQFLENTKNGFVQIGNEFINIQDISGIFTPKAMEEYRNIWRGLWKCKHDTWHERNEKCECWKI